MGVQLPCTVRAIKVSIPKLDIWEYVNAEISEAPSALPNGSMNFISMDAR
jgi:hypothetical protein